MTVGEFAFRSGAGAIVLMLLAWVASRFGFIVPRWAMLGLAGVAVAGALVYAIARGGRP